ncbi:MAG: hypothetical protein OXB95_07390 [Rhodobacteraceae bacterium]|nr:hypothetical protein [Paracoccaceae bacterium]
MRVLDVVASMPAFALLAADSTLCKINRFASSTGIDFDRIAITSAHVGRDEVAYAPLISWAVNKRDRRTKNVHDRHVRAFYSSLWQHAFASAVNTGLSSSELLSEVFQNPDVQLEAIDRLFEHTLEHGTLKCSKQQAKDMVNEHLEANQDLLTLPGHLTRRVTIRVLRKLGLVKEYRDGNPPLCPWDERVPTRIVPRLVEESNLLSPGELSCTSRVLDAVYSRNLAVNVMRETTSRNLQQIGAHIGGVHHSTVMYSLDKSRNYQNANPMYRQVHEAYCQVVDNGAIFLRLNASS